ncbi:MAG: VOC family protein [Bacillaceae bacterium]|nr:VOC family protein [Bacillaceae bacterium]
MKPWSSDLPVVQFRIARPTDQMKQVIAFYEDGLGLKRIGGFKGHAGYDGVMFGLPGTDYHLEFTAHEDGSPCPAPTKDNLLVFYIPDKEKLDAMAKRLAKMGYPEVEPENPYWKEKGVTIEDPDGWRIVLMNTEGI